MRSSEAAGTSGIADAAVGGRAGSAPAHPRRADVTATAGPAAVTRHHAAIARTRTDTPPVYSPSPPRRVKCFTGQKLHGVGSLSRTRPTAARSVPRGAAVLRDLDEDPDARWLV